MRQTIFRRILGLLLLSGMTLLTVRAGDIPKGYRGFYMASDGSWQLQLKESEALWQMAGSNLKLPVVRDTAAKIYVRLQQGKSGLYLAEPEKGVLQMTAFGVIFNNAPNPVPANGFNWRRATVFYLTLNREQPNPVSKLDFTLSGDGLVTLDTINNNWQIGWGPVATRYTVPRAEKP